MARVKSEPRAVSVQLLVSDGPVQLVEVHATGSLCGIIRDLLKIARDLNGTTARGRVASGPKRKAGAK